MHRIACFKCTLKYSPFAWFQFQTYTGKFQTRLQFVFVFAQFASMSVHFSLTVYCVLLCQLGFRTPFIKWFSSLHGNPPGTLLTLVCVVKYAVFAHIMFLCMLIFMLFVPGEWINQIKSNQIKLMADTVSWAELPPQLPTPLHAFGETRHLVPVLTDLRLCLKLQLCCWM